MPPGENVDILASRAGQTDYAAHAQSQNRVKRHRAPTQLGLEIDRDIREMRGRKKLGAAGEGDGDVPKKS